MTDWENSVKYTFINISSELKQFILLRYQYLCHTHNLECVPYYLNNGIDYFENSYSKNKTSIMTTTAPPPLQIQSIFLLLLKFLYQLKPLQSLFKLHLFLKVQQRLHLYHHLYIILKNAYQN
jgi:hypothetical protein